MNRGKQTSSSIDGYIAAQPPHVRAILQKIRTTIAKAVQKKVRRG